ncbi:sensor histidine kinase [Paenibacillus wynnii]|uniref:sensor histidine kinase n=1 Tax=Paenibacillus wynnii TaxID=268407 RepID=UPI0027935979|nr:HAMP domain-containing sensor histidine kinase [Paenibacillus wynnii]MDQ0195456.1 signal transduction histidine kinase [Paenibacillus wynnii]
MDNLKKQTSILSYWTIRYLIIISIGLLVTALTTFWWIKQEAMDNRMQTTGLLAQEIADRSVGPDGNIEVSQNLKALIENRKRFFKLTVEMCVIITNNKGQLLFSMPPLTEEEMQHKLNDELDDVRSPEYKAATASIQTGDTILGKVFVLQSKKTLKHIPQAEIGFFAIMLLFLIILSWLTIYLLSRKLARPILKVATAAGQISSGQYNIAIQANAKEREINELIVSFQEMAGRLKQLEHSRAIMLAGVSHELKTPVTSIKGLIHAVREKVVEGEEADEFLDIALLEAGKLQRMVADLLDYNALAAGVISIRHDRIAAVPLLSEIVYQWFLTQDSDVSEPELTLPDTPLFLRGDPLRVQQIIVNLLNNSVQAKQQGIPLKLTIELHNTGRGTAEIIITDNGKGILAEHRGLIFEAFFRGGYKQSTLRGLGLGLTFSSLLAESMSGSLKLRDHDFQEAGCTFVLTLPLQR